MKEIKPTVAQDAAFAASFKMMNGWLKPALQYLSPHFDARPEGVAPDLLVIHNISLPPHQFGGEWIKDFFCGHLDHQAHPYFEHLKDVHVSAHFLITRDGALTQFVACQARAWHAGASEFQGRKNCNDFSIGIELEGSDASPFEPAQYQTLVSLTRCLIDAYPICAIAGHQHIAPGRKTDPGPFFDWAKYQKDCQFFEQIMPRRVVFCDAPTN